MTYIRQQQDDLSVLVIGLATADPSSLPSNTQTSESATVLYTTSQEQKQSPSAPSSSSSDGKGAVNMSIVSAFPRHIGLSYIPVKDRRRIVNGVIDHFKSLLSVLIESSDVNDVDNSAKRLLPLLETIDIDTWADQFYGYTAYSMLTCLHYQLSHLFESHSLSLYTSLDAAVQRSRGDTDSRYDEGTSDITRNSTTQQKLVNYDHVSGVLLSLQTSTIGLNLTLAPSCLPGHLLQIPCLASTTTTTQRASPPSAGTGAGAFPLPSNSRTVFSVKGKCLRFAGIAGHSAIKQQLTEAIMWPRWYAALYSAFSTAADTGVLLFGPPGSGKEA